MTTAERMLLVDVDEATGQLVSLDGRRFYFNTLKALPEGFYITMPCARKFKAYLDEESRYYEETEIDQEPSE